MGECLLGTVHNVIYYTFCALALPEHAGYLSGEETAACEVSVKDGLFEGTRAKGADFIGRNTLGLHFCKLL